MTWDETEKKLCEVERRNAAIQCVLDHIAKVHILYKFTGNVSAWARREFSAFMNAEDISCPICKEKGD